jgi:hypothetical protein
LACYHNTNFKHFAHGTNLICLDSTKAPSLFPTLVVFPLGATLVESCTFGLSFVLV